MAWTTSKTGMIAVLLAMLPGLIALLSVGDTAIAQEGNSTVYDTATGVTSESISAQRPLSLEDCIGIAIDRNPWQEAARKGVVAAGESVGEKRASYYPQLDFKAGYARRETHAFLPGGLSIPSPVVGPTDDWSSNIVGHLILYDSGKRRAELLAAMANKEIAVEESARIRQDIILNVYKAFYGLSAAIENKAVIAKAIERAAENLRMSEERYAAGDVPLADILRARVEKSEIVLARVSADSLIKIARGNLNQAMGLAVTMDIPIIIPRVEIPEALPTFGVEALREAVENRPEIQVMRQRQEVANQSVVAAKSAFGPQLSATAQYGYRDDVFTPIDQDWYAGVSLEVPIFSGFARSHVLNRKRAELALVGAELAASEQLVSKEVWTSHWRLLEKYEAIEVANTVLADATESLRLAQERYENGVGIMADLLAAQAALIRGETVHMTSRWDYQVARAELQRAMGELKVTN